MSDIDKLLKEIIETDPLGILDIKPKTSSVLSADERLIASFEEINSFIETNDREPIICTDINERNLASRLKSLRENPEKAFALKDFDKFSLLAEASGRSIESVESINDILDNDSLGLIDDSSDPEDIFNIKHIPASGKAPKFVAKRKPCKEFERFEHLFKENHAALRARTKVTRPFNSERQIKPGEFFIVDGVMVYVANQGEWKKKNFGNFNARLYCVFENGTESNILLRSLAAALWKDKNSRQVIDANQMDLFESNATTNEEDQESGYIYIVSSLSEDPNIRSLTDLYKVGFSKNSVGERIKGAKLEPTYLMADVKVVAEFKTYNLNPQKFEQLIQRFFAETCLNVDVFDEDGRRYSPREWFIAPVHVITQAIEFILSGEITQFKYDSALQEIVRKSDKKIS